MFLACVSRLSAGFFFTSARMSVCIVLVLASAAMAAKEGLPLQLSLGPQLFIDDYLIASQTGLKRTVNSPKRLSKPMVTGLEDRCFAPYNTVLREPASGKFRMWYNTSGDGRLGYMESVDGTSWIRPHSQLGATLGNIAFGAGVIDRGSGCSEPASRYVYAWWDSKRGELPRGVHIAVSPDGLEWKPIAPGPVIQNDHDIVDIFYDRLRDRYLVSTSTYTPNSSGSIRTPTQSTSTDLSHWSRPAVTITPDGRDQGKTQFYGMSGIMDRGGLLIGLLKVLRDDLVAAGAPKGSFGVGYTVLCWSRDGEHWQRDTQPFIDRNPAVGAWDYAMAWGDTQLIVGDETYLYYGGYVWGHKTNRTTDRSIGLATIGVDRYVSRAAGDAAGALLTPVFVANADCITINASVKGELKVRILDGDGNPLPGFEWSDFSPISGDSVTFPARWMKSFSALKGVPIQLEFYLKDARLYAFNLNPVPKRSRAQEGDNVLCVPTHTLPSARP